MKCKVCFSDTEKLFKAKLLKKYDVQYYQCVDCGFIQTESPYWLEEAYETAITSSDLGLVSRNIVLSKILQALIHRFFDSDGCFADYGGGYGLLVRLMRDAGFDFYNYDKIAPNLFAAHFDVTESDSKSAYELVTAFEVFEHLADPLNEIEQMLQFSRNIFFTTALVPKLVPTPNEWSYYGFDHGQHVALYTYKALETVAKNFRINFYSDGKLLHLLTQKTLSSQQFYFFSRYKVAVVYNYFFGKKSLLPKDYAHVTGQTLNHLK